MYVLDEPSIGLHQRDNERLLNTLIHLRNLGNTVIVVEHDEDAIREPIILLILVQGRCAWWSSDRSGTAKEIMAKTQIRLRVSSYRAKKKLKFEKRTALDKSKL